MEDSAFPGNSRKQPSQEPEKKIEKVVTGKVTTRKKPLMRRFAETFIAEDSSSVARYIVMDVLIPAAKDLISDLVKETVDRTLFGGGRSGRSRGSSRSYGGHVNYNRYSSGSPPWRRDEDRPPMSRRARSRHNFDEIVLDTRAEANDVLDRMYDILDRYKEVTVADLYDLVGLEKSYTDEKWGWTDLEGSKVIRAHDGYILDLPKTEQID